MRSGSLLPVLKAALFAGLAAGLVMGLFHFVLTEPVIDRALALEDAAAKATDQATRYAPEVSRGVQKGMLVVGSALYGLLVGLVFAALLAVLRRHLPGRWPDARAAVLAGLLWWSVALLPALKYPANPPGVGNLDTVSYRQSIQLGFIALSVLATAAAWTAYRLSGRWWRDPGLQERRMGLAVVLYAVMAIPLFVFMPANPDPITAPADLIWEFRMLSMFGQVFFWAVLGVISAILLRRFARQGVLGEKD